MKRKSRERMKLKDLCLENSGNYIIATDKALFLPKSVDIFLIFPQNHMLWCH